MLSNRQRTIARHEIKKAIEDATSVISEQRVNMHLINEATQQFRDGTITSTELANYILNAHESVRADVTHQLLLRIYKDRATMADTAFERILA